MKLIEEKISYAEFKKRANIVDYGKGSKKKFIVYFDGKENFPYKYKVYPFKGGVNVEDLPKVGRKEENLKRAYHILFEKDHSEKEIKGGTEFLVGEFKIAIVYS